jgi:hypothetical protein
MNAPSFPVLALLPSTVDHVLDAYDRARGAGSTRPLIDVLSALPATRTSPHLQRRRERYLASFDPRAPARILQGARDMLDLRAAVLRDLRTGELYPECAYDALHAAALFEDDLSIDGVPAFRPAAAMRWAAHVHAAKVPGAEALLEGEPGPWALERRTIPHRWLPLERLGPAQRALDDLVRAGPPSAESFSRMMREVWLPQRLADDASRKPARWQLPWNHAAAVSRLHRVLRRFDRFLGLADWDKCGVAVGWRVEER